MKITRTCDACRKRRKLYFFRTFGGGYVAYCRDCAVRLGYLKESDLNGSGRAQAVTPRLTRDNPSQPYPCQPVRANLGGA